MISRGTRFSNRCDTGAAEQEDEARTLYFRLLDAKDDTSRDAQRFLSEQLELTRGLECDLPDRLHPDGLERLASHMKQATAATCGEYRDYLASRRRGSGRRYFPTRSHALHFLQAVAPTKLVDGCWLYGLLGHWRDPRFTALIQIYLEELGEGIAEQNHVVIFNKLLTVNGCDAWQDMSDAHFVQGAIQLSLAHHASRFLPELIGFNLGYEQLPLHLLISAYELEELGIDPFYFTLHVTIDNADTGHASKSLRGLHDAIPRIGDAEAFYQRVRRGYMLNQLGAGSTAIIESFDLGAEVEAILVRKSQLGKHLHSSDCRIGGRSINAWLADPRRVRELIVRLEQNGWIRRQQDPAHSPFWRLIQGSQAKMFGVFTATEQQFIYDWIAGDSIVSSPPGAIDMENRGRGLPQRHISARIRPRMLGAVGEFNQTGTGSADSFAVDDFNRELRQLESQLAALGGKDQVMERLIELMSPSQHHTSPGLMATRVFTRMLG